MVCPILIILQVRVVFGDQVCRDCGQRGDERLLSDLCHERKVEKERKLLNFNCGKKKVCSNCGEAWSRYVAQIQKMELELNLLQETVGNVELHKWSSLCSGEEPEGRQARGEAGRRQGGAHHAKGQQGQRRLPLHEGPTLGE